jgi:hypothetical protein
MILFETRSATSILNGRVNGIPCMRSGEREGTFVKFRTSVGVELRTIVAVNGHVGKATSLPRETCVDQFDFTSFHYDQYVRKLDV